MPGTLIHPISSEHETNTISLYIPAYSMYKAVEVAEPRSVVKHNFPKGYQDWVERTTGLPKCWKTYGNGVSILAISRMQGYSKVRQFHTGTLRTAANAVVSNKVTYFKMPDMHHTGVYKKIADIDTLIQAYEKLKSRPGSMTPGTDGNTLDGYSIEKLESISKSLKDESYKCKPVKRVYIPKANGKKRPLGIPNIDDRIVQQASKIVLEKIFEPNFADTSHGYRPHRSCHSALKQMETWNGVHWIIEGDIKGFFDNVDHHLLSGLLNKIIKDQQLIDLYWKWVRAGYIYLGVNYPSSGVPQGGIISPLLSNIYLHELDCFVEKLFKELNLNNKNKTKKVYSSERRKAAYQVEKYSKLYKEDKDPQTLKLLNKAKVELRLTPQGQTVGQKAYYCRYADDWVIGVLGKKTTAETIRNEVSEFLTRELNLELNLDKTKITNVKCNYSRFLGFDISRNMRKEKKITTINRKSNNGQTTSKFKMRVGNTKLKFYLPFQEIMTKLSEKGFMRPYRTGSGDITPTGVNKWIFLDHESILQRYNAIIRGYQNYYGPANNVNKLHHINFILKHSCAKTLARKYRLRSRNKVFRKFGPNLTCKLENGKSVSLAITKTQKYQGFNKLKPINMIDFLKPASWQIRSQSNLFKACKLCGSTENVEMHHVRKLSKDKKFKDSYTALMSTLKRKQIPVCQKCHRLIHQKK